jgi:hypothetical protein
MKSTDRVPDYLMAIMFPGGICIMNPLIVLAATALLFVATSAADAKGCIKGAVVGGAAGHAVGHGVVGAATGCYYGRKRANQQAQQQKPTNAQPK